MDDRKIVVEDTTDSMLSGGLLVALGVILALVLGAIFFKDRYSNDQYSSVQPDVRVVEVPVIQQIEPASGNQPTEPAAPATVNVQTPAPIVNVQPAPDVNVQVPAPNINVHPQAMEPASGNTQQFDSYNGASDGAPAQEVYPAQ